jgi:hypothetical protein
VHPKVKAKVALIGEFPLSPLGPTDNMHRQLSAIVSRSCTAEPFHRQQKRPVSPLRRSQSPLSTDTCNTFPCTFLIVYKDLGDNLLPDTYRRIHPAISERLAEKITRAKRKTANQRIQPMRKWRARLIRKQQSSPLSIHRGVR